MYVCADEVCVRRKAGEDKLAAVRQQSLYVRQD